MHGQYQPNWDVLFLNESMFKISYTGERWRIWHGDDERYAAKYIGDVQSYGGGSVMVGISTDHRTELIVIDSAMTAKVYYNT